MTTGTPVVVSRIQNRRGTQSQFDALYPTYPGVGNNILQPGEIALCTDTRRVFVGNLNGEYVEIAVNNSQSNISFLPVQVSLPPVSVMTPIPELVFAPTSFLTILYSMTDVPSAIAAPGLNFSKNGELHITAIVDIPLQPNHVSLTDNSIEVNTLAADISISADYNLDGNIELSYVHNFPFPVTFNTSTIIWTPI
jgi:hypothetical protein